MSSKYVLKELEQAIKSSVIKNFLSHHCLKIDFNNNMSFVIGRNGSGQRTILTALFIGLGASASSIGGRSLQSYIKKGQNSASIEIKLRNNSPNAYKPDVYGDMITITRTINSSGTTFCEVKSVYGEIISTKPEEVSMICTVHNIQVDNAVCILNQADARYFRAVDSKIKYGYFRKATNVDIVLQNCNRILYNFAKANDTIANRKKTFSVLEEQVKKLKSPHEKLKFKEKIEGLLKTVENELRSGEIEKLRASLQVVDDDERTKQREKIKTSIRALNNNSNDTPDIHNKTFSELAEKVENLKLFQNDQLKTQDEIENQSKSGESGVDDIPQLDDIMQNGLAFLKRIEKIKKMLITTTTN